MKTLKISLVVVVLGAILFFIIKSFGGTPPPAPPVSQPKNASINNIVKEITILDSLPNNKFCKDKYNEIMYLINDNSKDLRLGKDQTENEQWKENLSRDLIITYSDKFIKQTLYVFGRPEWNTKDIDFIRSESIELRNSKFLEKGTAVDSSLLKIQETLSKYDEINSFIYSCLNFSYNENSLNSIFPIETVKNKISKAIVYKQNKLGNSYVNNCSRLHSQLNAIPQSLFDAHYKYLKNKLNHWSGLFSAYNSQKEYVNNYYNPRKEEIYLMYITIYNAKFFSSKQFELLQIINKDSRDAYSYFNPKSY